MTRTVADLPDSILVLGGGVAAYTFVEQLRLRGYRGSLAMVSMTGLPHDLPPVSKEYLRGNMSREELDFRDADFYVERDIHVVNGTATALRLPAQGAVQGAVPGVGETDGDVTGPDEVCLVEVARADGGEPTRLSAGLVVLATGARPVSATAHVQPAVERDRITTLHSVADADRVRSLLVPGARVVILGGGLIGAEAASAAVEAGARVTLVNRSAPAGARGYGPAAAAELEEQHVAHGVRLITSFSVGEQNVGDGVDVSLETGEVLHADLVIDAGGAVPADGLARTAGVEVWDDAVGGVRVDSAGHTSHQRVLAIGDVARSGERWSGHWEAAMHSAEDAAAAVLGQGAETRGVPWFWSDRHGSHVEVVGNPAAATVDIERRDDRGLRAVFWCVPAGADEGHGAEAPGGAQASSDVGQVVVTGAVTIDDSRLARAARRLADRAKPVDAEALADPAIAARALLR
ncbi:FAD-dependent oxidoreductase [Galactobacter sp.]|uniref:FAD-dependent oxidoreductase n=1 Tax=Galactobacter sp. TaxID=2676125 RepID=UPI0025C3C2FF|nr:FAD-dependent oxidoreductase [Galactobacter sp.]